MDKETATKNVMKMCKTKGSKYVGPLEVLDGDICGGL